MPNQQPIIGDASGRRTFARSAAGVLAFIVDAIELYRLWKDQHVDLQPDRASAAPNKYALP